jgi:hypothetical protein
MSNIIRYVLSDIPGFQDIINNDYSDNSNILKLNKVECRTSNNTPYKVVRYDKNFLSYDLISSYGLCRSVIINNINKVVGFAPPKSICCQDFIKKYTENTIEVVAEEFIEGTMINVFWDDSIGLTGGWEIATRNTVGATSSFYKGPKAKTFRKMFLEAAKKTNLTLENLDKEFCYSFVLQHPENRIVVPFKKPELFLVATYRIYNNDNSIYVDNIELEDIKDKFKSLNFSVQFPKIYTFQKYADLIEQYASMNTSYDIVGVILHHKITGERTKIRNPVYEQVRNLRGNQPKLQYQYLCLRKEGKVSDFLKYYPENKRNFSEFRDHIHLFTETLFTNYISCYIKKEKPLSEFTSQYKTHLYNLHQRYLNDLRLQNLFVNSTVVIKYVNELHPSLLMYSLNYQMRKRNIDTIISNSE